MRLEEYLEKHPALARVVLGVGYVLTAVGVAVLMYQRTPGL